MFKKVDETPDQVEGFMYTNKDGNDEYVHKANKWGVIKIATYENQHVDIYKEDIPKLVKALQAAYDHKESYE